VTPRGIGHLSIRRSRALKMRPVAVDCRATMRLPVSRFLLLVCALLAVVPATASAAAPPKVSSVAPLQLKVGDTLTIRGKGFIAGKNRNTVIFKATGTRAVFAKAQTATKTKLVVKVPAKLLSFLKVSNGRSVATRFQIRVLAERLSAAYTPSGKSPVIAPATTTAVPPATKPATGLTATSGSASAATGTGAAAPAGGASSPGVTLTADCDGDHIPDATDPDDDNDLLPDTVERQIGTQTCNPDSDGDGMTDGWEYKSALDLEQRSCPGVGDYPTPCAAAKPYPYKRPYPNPLDGTDAGTDYDGDGLSASLEFTAWHRKALADPSWNTLTNLWYSDGLQASQDTSAAAGCRGMAVPPVFDGNAVRPEFARPTTPVSYPDLSQPEYQIYTLDRIGRAAHDGCLNDAERDEDGDYLTNWEETVGPFSPREFGPGWWSGVYKEPDFKTPMWGTDWLDPDTDGNGVVDGLDDIDHDDFLNVEEIVRGAQSRNKDDHDTGFRSGLWVQPYNPCLPSPNSRTCPRTLDLNLEAWRPFKKDPSDADPLPRWPLYGVLDPSDRANDITDVVYNPHDVDPDALKAAQQTDPNVDPNTLPDVTSPEVWSPPVAFGQTMPPLHPLPR
jgi:hypothetical protein